MAGHKQARRADVAKQLISDAVRNGGGECVPLHDGVLYATIPDPGGRTDPTPVLLTIRATSTAVALYEGYMRTKGFVPDDTKDLLRDAYLRENLELPPELHDDR